MENGGVQKKPKKPKIRFRIIIKENEALTWIKISEQMGFRGRGFKIFTQKKNGFDGELCLNTKGFAKTARFCVSEFDRMEVERLKKKVEIEEKEKQLAEEKKRLGMI